MDDYSRQLLDAVHEVVADWVERCIRSVCTAQGIALTDTDREIIGRAADETQAEVHRQLSALLELDVDEQRSNPLDILRRAVGRATTVLRDLGASPVPRDEFAQRVFPDDVYDLSPASFAQVDERLTEPGIVWGAWKAKTVLDRRRAEGRLPPS